MKFIDEVDLQNKRVVLRCDFNVPIEKGLIENDTRIVKSLKTINYLLNEGCSIVLLSHMGRVKSKEDISNNSLRVVCNRLSELLNKKIPFYEHSQYNSALVKVNSLHSGDIILLENTRNFDYPCNLESQNNLLLAKYYASLGDVFVNDAFASMHRIHSSTAGISNYLPTFYGLLVKEEVFGLKNLITNIAHPFTVFMGASKIDDKIIYMEGLLKKCDYLLLGGGVANSFCFLLGKDIGNSIHTSSKKALQELKRLLELYQNKIILPDDFMIKDNQIRDIGEKSITKYQNYFKDSHTIFMNGTPGQFEKNEYSNGTKLLLSSLKDINSVKVAGGGATLNAISKFKSENSFTYLSSGGGASLEYISSGNLAAMEYIEKNESKVLKK